VRLLLDTHAFLWFVAGDRRMTKTGRTEIESAQNLKIVSVASLWEIAIKASLGKLALKEPFETLIPQQMEVNGFELLHIQIGHLARMTSLPFHHRDPFDRLIASQCLADELSLVSCDPAFDPYGVSRIW
jgi:PIN domain nuclease of toxin-antitoxin system